MQPTFLLRCYAGLTRTVWPLAWWVEHRKLSKAKTPDARHREKLGEATLPRPDGTLVWFHAASVGESLSVLALIDAMARQSPTLHFLITSGTPTSAALLEKRLPARSRHQFAPLDAPACVNRFLDHWQPNASLLVESELWPNMLMSVNAREIPMALINARLSQRSIEGWKKYPDTARAILSGFRLILTQNPQMRADILSLGSDPGVVRAGFNLKSLAAPLPINDGLRADLQAALGTRPLWIASSTHPGEEEIVLEAHARLLARHPDLCLILAPRHPDRGEAVAKMIAAQGWPVPRRTRGDLPDGPVYLADTLGELGTLYDLGNIVFLGGSIAPMGGHNPFEVVHGGAAILSGSHIKNFSETYDKMSKNKAVAFTDTADDIVNQVDLLLTDQRALESALSGGAALIEGAQHRLEATSADLLRILDLPRA